MFLGENSFQFFYVYKMIIYLVVYIKFLYYVLGVFYSVVVYSRIVIFNIMYNIILEWNKEGEYCFFQIFWDFLVLRYIYFFEICLLINEFEY